MQIKEHRKKTLLGLKWAGLSQLILQIVNLIFNIVLARLLSPDEFGLIAMLAVFVGFLNLFKDFGFGSILISQDRVNDIDYCTVFWTNLGLGIVLTSLLWLLGPLIVDFYSEPQLEDMIYVISTLFTIQSFNFVQLIVLKRELQFKKIAFVNISTTLASSVLAILSALGGGGVWSLIIKDLSQATMFLMIIWKMSSWKPSFKFSAQRLVYFFRAGFTLVGTKVLNFLSRSVDNVLIGKYIGTAGLGLYNRAYSFMTFPVYNISGVLSSVLFPSFSIIQDDLQRMRDVFLKSIETTSFVMFLIMGLLYVNASEFVLLLLGPQWKGLIPIFRILALPSALQSVTVLTENIFRSKNKYHIEFKLNIVVSSILILAIVVGLKFGIIGVATGYSIAVFITSIIILAVTADLLETGIYMIIKKIFPSLISFVFLIILKYFYDRLDLGYELSLLSNFIIQLVLGSIFYLGLFYLIDKKGLYSTFNLIKNFGR